MDKPKPFSKCKGQAAEKFLQKKFGKRIVEDESFSENVKCLQPTKWLNETLEIALLLVKKIGRVEQARSVFVISNIILELYKHYNNGFAIYTEQKLTECGLTGFLDYILGQGKQTGRDKDEYKVVIEVKINTGYRNFRRSYGQCIAQMIAMQCFNTKNESKVSNIYGALTNAETWQFMKLTDNKFYVEPQRYQIDNDTEKILGVLAAMIRDEL